MKKLLLSLTAITAMSVTAFSQTIPNASFENWGTFSSCDEPTSWQTSNFLTFFYPLLPCTGTKGAPGSAGAAYLQLTSKTDGGQLYSVHLRQRNSPLTNDQLISQENFNTKFTARTKEQKLLI